jgi:MFS family permease
MSVKTPVLVATSIAAFITTFMSASVNIALPTIGREMGAETALLNWTATSFLLAAAMFLVFFGKLAVIHGRYRVFSIGMIVFVLSSLGCALSPTIIILVVLRAVQGLGGAMVFGSSTAILTSAFPSGGRGRALGINVRVTCAGLSVGPFFGGLLTQHLGWRSLFVAGGVLALGGLAVIAALVREEWIGAEGERFDLAGSAIYAAGLALFMYWLSLLPALEGGALILAGVVSIVLFVLRETRIAHPVLSVSLFRGNRVFALSNLASLARGSVHGKKARS